MDLISGRGIKETISEFNKKYIPTMIANCKFWPIISTINFTLIPIQYRVLFDNFGSIFWNIYLSFIQNKKEEKKNQVVIYPLEEIVVGDNIWNTVMKL